MSNLIFVDIDARNRDARERLLDRRTTLVNRIEEAEASGRLPDRRLQQEVREIDFRLANGRPAGPGDTLPDYSTTPPAETGAVVDPLFHAVVDDVDVACAGEGCNVASHDGGRLRAEGDKDPDPARALEVAYIYGALLRDGADRPGDTTAFARQLSIARSEYRSGAPLAHAVAEVLARSSSSPRLEKRDPRVRAEQVAAVTRELREQGVTEDDMHLALKVQAALARTSSDGDGAAASALEISLPELGDYAATEIQRDNLQAMQAIYYAAMLEDMRVFQVVDKLVEMYEYGMLPIVRGPDADRLYSYRRDRVNRLSEIERRNLYARALGQPGGEPHLQNQNREFQTLMVRFVSAVASYARQATVDQLLRSSLPNAVHQEQVRKAASDLAQNLSLHAYGMAFNAAVELQRTLRDAFAILQGPDVKSAFGARDMYQVIEQVAALELGGFVDTTRYQTLARTGALAIAWLKNHAGQLSSGYGDVLDLREILNPGPRPSGSRALDDPTDADLVNACERYLAEMGTSDEQVEQYASPRAGGSSPSRPIQIPSIARDALSGAGIDLGGGDGFSFDSIGV